MKKIILMLAIVATALLSSVSAFAGDHPAYLHALADLRAARWYIEHRPSDTWRQVEDQVAAVREIDAAINEIKQAAIDDHKDLRDHVGAQQINEREGRFHKAIELLRRSRGDVNEHEDNVFAKNLKARALHHIDEAIKFVERAIANR